MSTLLPTTTTMAPGSTPQVHAGATPRWTAALRILGVICLLCQPWTAPALGRDTPQVAELLEQADAAFAQGVEAEAQSPGRGSASFLRAAALYDRCMREGDLENHALHANRASALLLAGDVGRSIAAFRRAQRLDPTDPAVRNGLSAARARVGASFAPAIDERGRQILLAWRGYVPRWSLLALVVVGWATAWAAGAGRALGARSAGRWVIVGAAIACAGAAPLACETLLASRPAGVVVANDVVGLNGPGLGAYEPTFESPIPAGVEFEILERRAGWVKARLSDGRETWLQEAGVERI